MRDLDAVYTHKAQNLIRSLGRDANNIYVCPHYLHRFWNQHLLDHHLPDCSTHKPCIITFPSAKPREDSVKPRKDSHIVSNGEEEVIVM
jgi:hypothetical protein